MKNRIVWKLTACFAVVLLLFTVVLGAVFVSMFRRHTIAINRSAMEEKAVSIADTLAAFQTAGGTGMGRSGMGGYGAYLRFLNELAMAEIWIVDENMNLLTAGHGRFPVSYAELPDNAEQIVKRVFEGETTYGEEFSSLLDTPMLTVGAPIRINGAVSGAVLLHSPVSGVDVAVYQGLYALAAGAVVALLFAGVAAIFLSYRFTDPLRRMKTAALRLADGDYTAETGVAQSDEVGQLAQTIDFLSGRLMQAERERSALDQLKQDFVANVSHELRTPVAVLRGSLEVLRDGTVSNPGEILDYYEQMLAESRHLERLVNDLLDLSRLQDIKFQLDMDEVNLCDVVRDSARTIRRAAQSKRISVSVSCPEEACIVYGDYGRIRQLLLILLDNAVKFSHNDGTVELELGRRKGGHDQHGDGDIQYEGGHDHHQSGCDISVTDHGAGISHEELPYIFERFRKTHTSENQSGTGLGLAIAKEIADRHGASIEVESGEGKTRFLIRFFGKAP